MKTICFDFGNSFVKVAIFNNFNQTNFEIFPKSDRTKILDFISKFEIEAAIISTVSEPTDFLKPFLKNAIVVELSHTTVLTITNNYKTPETLGKDRIAAAVGANYMYPNTNLLVIDAGTAITYDIVDCSNCYLGGNISLGMATRFRALHQFTERLPLLSLSEKISEIGKNTNEAIQIGVQQGLLFEIDGFIEYYQSRFTDLKVLFTGGDANYFDNKLKNAIFVVPNLVMIGLNRILYYHVENS